ncbi:hypothetical protein EOM57_04930 [Candidatus Saccharibacteria bacterium]|nr:hypothetical protein [Candidatus Saccharibacteria bacterium]
MTLRQIYFVIIMTMSTFLKTYSGSKIKIPDYDGECITKLPVFFQNTLQNSRENILAREVAGKVRLDEITNVVFFLVDGFGLKQWKTYKNEYGVLEKFERDGYLGKLDSVFPSSTPVALSTLHTNGLLPAEHGLVDWWLYVEEIDKIIATLPFAAMGSSERDSLLKIGASPSILLDYTTTYEQFEEQGIKTRTFIHENYNQSAYTDVAYKGSELVTHKNVNDLFVTLFDELTKPQEQPTYNFVYWGAIDAAGHKYGPDSSEHKQAIREYFTALDEFFVEANDIKNTLFVISADHGQINVDPEQTIYLDTVAGLSELFKVSHNGNQILPWGAQREMFLAIKDGELNKALGLLHKAIGEHVELVTSEEALRAGLFGQTLAKHPDIKSRIGDIIVLPKDEKTVWYHHPGEEPFSLNGQHGGLSDAELKVPFGLMRLN